MITLLYLLTLSFSAQSDVAELVRIAIVDVSKSMEDENRLATAQQELLQFAKDDPPSAQRPFVVIPFCDQCLPPQTFTDFASLEKMVKGFKADGGTNIATALAQARSLIPCYQKAGHIVLLLYSDGEDPNQAAILKEESELDKLFAVRRKDGLGQSVVFCKRWQGANQQLLDAFKRSPNAQVIDASALKVTHVPMEPDLRIDSAYWIPGKPLHAEIKIAGSLAGAPAELLKQFGPLEAKLEPTKTPRTIVSGGDRIALGIGQSTKTTLVVHLSQHHIDTGELDLDFTIEQPKPKQSGQSLLTPYLSKPKISLRIPLKQHEGVLIHDSQPGVAEWIDPVERTFKVVVSLKNELKGDFAGQFPAPVTITLTPKGTTTVISGDTLLKTSTLGKVTGTITLGGKLDPNQTDTSVEFSVSTAGPLKFVPATLEIKLPLQPPAPVVTNLKPRLVRTNSPQWLDPVKGIALVEGDLELETDGPVPNGTKFAFAKATGTEFADALPDAIVPGKQTIHFRVAVNARAKTKIDCPLPIELPRGSVGVHFKLDGPLQLTTTGPDPIPVWLTDHTGNLDSLRLTMADNEFSAQCSIVPRVDPITDQVLAGVKVSLIGQDGVSVVGDRDSALEEPTQLRLAPRDPQPNFWRDTTMEGNLKVFPDSAAVGLIGATYPVEICVQAVFKRVVFWIVCILAGATIFGMLWYAWAQLSEATVNEADDF